MAPELESAAMRACVTGATGFVGGHVAAALSQRSDDVRVVYRNPRRLERLRGVDCQPVRADVLDGAAMRSALRGVDVLFHAAGFAGSRPLRRVFELNARAPRIVVEAAAREHVRRVVVTSSVFAIGPAPEGELADERQPYPAGLGIAYADAKHEGEAEALAAGARHGVEVVIVNPAFALGVPVDGAQPGEAATGTVGEYLLGRLPAVVEGAMNFVDVRDVAAGHLLAADRGTAGERYILGGQNLTWAELVERIARISRIGHPVVVLPAEAARVRRLAESLGLPGSLAPEAARILRHAWRCSSQRARRELGYAARPLERTLREAIDWYLDLLAAGAFEGLGPSPLGLAARGLRLGDRVGLLAALRAVERSTGRHFLAGR